MLRTHLLRLPVRCASLASPESHSCIRLVAKRLYTRHPESSTVKGWKYYKSLLQDKPFSHLTSFIILHELTAVIPIASFYYFQSAFDVNIPVPSFILEGTDKFVNWAISSMVDPSSQEGNFDKPLVILRLGTAYGIVKMLMPLRLILSFYLTPWFARAFVEPCTQASRRLLGLVKK
jgi:hypothetical protein